MGEVSKRKGALLNLPAVPTMLVAALLASLPAWSVRTADISGDMRSVACLCIDEFESLPLPLLPFPGWKEKAREEAVSKWITSRQALLSGSQPHALLVAMRNQAEAGRYFEGVDDGLLGFAEVGLLPAPPEKTEQGHEAPVAPASPELYPYLANLAVKAGARRLGLGKALVVSSEGKATELGYSRMYIKVDRDNFDARRLYDRNGYKLVYMQNRMPDRTNKQTQFLFLRKDLAPSPTPRAA